MKITKTSIHRLTVEKTCGCQATREYGDARYSAPIAEGVFTPCEKHEKNKLVAEFAGEVMLEALDKEAEASGKAPASREPVPTALSGTTGESVQSMGAPKVRDKVDPLKPHTARVARPDARRPQNTAYGNLSVAGADGLSDEEIDEAGITITGDIDGVPQDPRVDAALSTGFEVLEEAFDEEDIRTGGVSKKLINSQAVD